MHIPPNTNTPTAEHTHAEHDLSVPSEPLLSWEASLHTEYARSPRWYMAVSTVVLLVALYGILSNTWTLSLVAVVIGSAYLLTRTSPPIRKKNAVFAHGMRINDRDVPWENCRDFWFIHTPSYCRLHVRLNKGVQRELRTEIHHIDEPMFKALLSHYLAFRADQKETFIDTCIRFLTL